MATPDNNQNERSNGHHFNPAILLATLALLAPLSYLAGRVSAAALAGTYLRFIGSGISLAALGVMMGIPVGLFFGSLRSRGGANSHAAAPNTHEMERTILEEIRRELAENFALFQARQGSTTMFARIEYITAFWNAVKASGRLFVMQDAQLLNTMATAYYWLDQASHLETLAYEAKYMGQKESGRTAGQLIAEVRLLDGQLQNSLEAAIAAIDTAISAP